MGICNSANETEESDCTTPLGKCHIGKCRSACFSKCCRRRVEEKSIEQLEEELFQIREQLHQLRIRTEAKERERQARLSGQLTQPKITEV